MGRRFESCCPYHRPLVLRSKPSGRHSTQSSVGLRRFAPPVAPRLRRVPCSDRPPLHSFVAQGRAILTGGESSGACRPLRIGLAPLPRTYPNTLTPLTAPPWTENGCLKPGSKLKGARCGGGEGASLFAWGGGGLLFASLAAGRAKALRCSPGVGAGFFLLRLLRAWRRCFAVRLGGGAGPSGNGRECPGWGHCGPARVRFSENSAKKSHESAIATGGSRHSSSR